MSYDSCQFLPSRKFRMLRVKQILERETDSAHGITMTRLLELLGEEEGGDRRTLYDDIRDLEYTGTTVTINKHHRPPQLNVEKRLFTLDELKLLIDAVASSKFLTQKASGELIDKLKGFCSRYEAAELKRQTMLSNRAKRIDVDFHNNVSTISKAIDRDRQIAFRYFRAGVHSQKVYDKYESVVSPWVTLYADDNYYTMAYDGTMMRYYRIDRMESIRQLPSKRLGEEAFRQVKEEMPFRTQATFNLFGGKKEYVTLRCPIFYYYVILDKFGSSLHPTVDKSAKTVTVTVPVAVGDMFFGWVLSMGNKVTIVGPEEVRWKMYDLLRSKVKQYKK